MKLLSHDFAFANLLTYVFFTGILNQALCLSSTSASSRRDGVGSIHADVDPACLRSSTLEHETKNKELVVISLNKNGGKVQLFQFDRKITGTSPLQDSPVITQKNRTSTNVEGVATGSDLVQTAIFHCLNSVKKFRFSSQIRAKQLWINLLSILRSTFLPTGYPSKTPNGYLRYSVWSWIQDLTTQLRGVLATQRILEGVGVGRADATSLSALLNFLLRDASGMVASLLFTASYASQFRTDIKRWRLLADVMVDIGITLEVLAVSMPRQLFVPFLCLGNVFKAICGVAAGSVGGAINLFWAKGGSDISDIQAKFGAQHTVTASIGLVASAVFAKSVSANIQSTIHLYTLYAALTSLHIYANMKCMRLIAFNSFNTVRLQMVLNYFLNDWCQGLPTSIPTPEEITHREPLFFTPSIVQFFKTLRRQRKQQIVAEAKIFFGVSFNEFKRLSGNTIQHLEQLMKLESSRSSNGGYYLISTGLKHYKPCVVVSLSENCTPETIIQAYFHASLLCRTLSEASKQQLELYKQRKSVESEQLKISQSATLRNDLVSFEGQTQYPNVTTTRDVKEQTAKASLSISQATNSTADARKKEVQNDADIVSFESEKVFQTQYSEATTGRREKERIDDTWNRSRWIAESLAARELKMAWKTFQENCSRAGWDLSAPSEVATAGYEISTVQA